MTKGLIQGKSFLVRSNGQFKITEFEFAGFNYTSIINCQFNFKCEMSSSFSGLHRQCRTQGISRRLRRRSKDYIIQFYPH